MGKPKKAHQDKEQDDFEKNDINLEAGNGIQNDTETQNSTQPSGKGERKKKAKKSKQKDDDWDDIEAEMQGLNLVAKNGSEEEDNIPVPKKSKNKKKGASAFALLAELDDAGVDDLSDQKSDNEDEIDKKSEIEVVPKSKKKEKSKKEKPKTQEEEEIDALLADIEKKPTEKKKKKKNKGDIQEDNIDQETESPVQEIEKVESKVVSIDDLDDEFEDDKKKRKKNRKKAKEDDVSEDKNEEGDDENKDEEEGTIKTAAQKKKEKKEREKQKKLEEKQKQLKKEQMKKEKETTCDKTQDAGGDKPNKSTQNETGGKSNEPGTQEDVKSKEPESHEGVKSKEPDSHEATPEADGEEKEGKKKKKKKAEKAKEKEDKKEDTKKPKNKQIAALKEALRIKKEEEEEAKRELERLKLEEEERIRRVEEEIRQKEELKRIKKEQKKEREAQLKKEGKFLTEKQKQDQKKLEQMLAAMKMTGIDIAPKSSPDGAPTKRVVYGKRKKQTGNKEKSPSTITSPTTEESQKIDPSESPEVETKEETKQEPVESVKDAWDADSEEEEEEEIKTEDAVPDLKVKKSESSKKEEEEEDESEDVEEEEEEDETSDESDESESESESEEEKSPLERARDKIQKRMEKAEKERTLDHLRAPVVCVLGHVDTGKTKILDKLRRTNVQDGEAGGITQQIGATNVPKDAIVEKTKMVKEFAKQELKIPGLLIIDTPGHESFSNLRLRGSSLCDIAILVIDIMHGLEPQTIESIKLLKERKTPFLVALNKIDRLYQWKPQPLTDVQNVLKKQTPHTKAEFDERAQQVMMQLAEEGLNSALFYDNKNPREYVSLVPTSAHTGDGMGNLVALVCELCQTMLAKRLMYCSELQATVMEVKAITGMGTTIDVILINGSLNEGDTIVLAGTEGPIITQIRGLLMPQPMKELRVKNQYEHHKTVMAAQGVKINAKEMEKCLAGLPLFVAHDNDEKEYYKDEVATVLKDTLESIKVQDRGVFVQASTLGSLEALLEFLRTSKIPYAGINIGPVHKKDIMRASVMLEHDSQYAVILAFDIKVEREAQELADNLGVRIFTAEIIYHLFDAFTKYREDLKRQKQEEFKHIAVFPCKLRILPQYIFNSRDPIVMGVIVEAGFVKEGTPICVPSKEFVEIGRVASMELNHKTVDVARQGQEICIKIVPTSGDAPKMYGRHFEETDMLVSKISRESIDAVKDYFRDEMTKPDWKVMIELKKQFDIL